MNPTEAELLLWQHLREGVLGVKFFRQYVIADFIVDFVSLQARLIIEVDGAYHSEQEQQEHDQGRSARLERLGFKVIRFSNEDIFNSIDSVITIIKANLQ